MVAATTSARRDELLDAAVRVIQREGPQVSMDVMAAEAGITKPILYRHFGDKGGLVTAVAERFVGRLMADMALTLRSTPPGPGLVAATVDAYLSFVDKEPEVWGFLNIGPPLDKVDGHAEKARFIALVGEQMAGFLAASGLPDEQARVYGHAVVGLVQSVGDWWLTQGRKPPRKRLVAYISELLWNGFGHMTEGNANG